MRDRGFNFFWQDLYAKNIHARTFEHEEGTRYDLVTAFELMEHLPDPLEGMAPIFALSDNVLTMTLLAPDPPPRRPTGGTTLSEVGSTSRFILPQLSSNSPVTMVALFLPATASTCSLSNP